MHNRGPNCGCTRFHLHSPTTEGRRYPSRPEREETIEQVGGWKSELGQENEHETKATDINTYEQIVATGSNVRLFCPHLSPSSYSSSFASETLPTSNKGFQLAQRESLVSVLANSAARNRDSLELTTEEEPQSKVRPEESQSVARLDGKLEQKGSQNEDEKGRIFNPVRWFRNHLPVDFDVEICGQTGREELAKKEENGAVEEHKKGRENGRQNVFVNNFGELIIPKVSPEMGGKYSCLFGGQQSELVLHVANLETTNSAGDVNFEINEIGPTSGLMEKISWQLFEEKPLDGQVEFGGEFEEPKLSVGDDKWAAQKESKRRRASGTETETVDSFEGGQEIGMPKRDNDGTRSSVPRGRQTGAGNGQIRRGLEGDEQADGVAREKLAELQVGSLIGGPFGAKTKGHSWGLEADGKRAGERQDERGEEEEEEEEEKEEEEEEGARATRMKRKLATHERGPESGKVKLITGLHDGPEWAKEERELLAAYRASSSGPLFTETNGPPTAEEHWRGAQNIDSSSPSSFSSAFFHPSSPLGQPQTNGPKKGYTFSQKDASFAGNSIRNKLEGKNLGATNEQARGQETVAPKPSELDEQLLAELLQEVDEQRQLWRDEQPGASIGPSQSSQVSGQPQTNSILANKLRQPYKLPAGHPKLAAHLVEGETISTSDLSSIPGLLYTKHQFYCPSPSRKQLVKILAKQIGVFAKNFCHFSSGVSKSPTGHRETVASGQSKREADSSSLENVASEQLGQVATRAVQFEIGPEETSAASSFGGWQNEQRDDGRRPTVSGNEQLAKVMDAPNLDLDLDSQLAETHGSAWNGTNSFGATCWRLASRLVVLLMRNEAHWRGKEDKQRDVGAKCDWRLRQCGRRRANWAEKVPSILWQFSKVVWFKDARELNFGMGETILEASKAQNNSNSNLRLIGSLVDDLDAGREVPTKEDLGPLEREKTAAESSGQVAADLEVGLPADQTIGQRPNGEQVCAEGQLCGQRVASGCFSVGAPQERPPNGEARLVLEIDGLRKEDAGRYSCAFQLDWPKLVQVFISLRRLALELPREAADELDNCAQWWPNCVYENDKSLCCDPIAFGERRTETGQRVSLMESKVAVALEEGGKLGPQEGETPGVLGGPSSSADEQTGGKQMKMDNEGASGSNEQEHTSNPFALLQSILRATQCSHSLEVVGPKLAQMDERTFGTLNETIVSSFRSITATKVQIFALIVIERPGEYPKGFRMKGARKAL